MLIKFTPPRSKASDNAELFARIFAEVQSWPAQVIDDMRNLVARTDEATDLLARADALRSELNEAISKLNAREVILDSRESALQRRETAVERRESALTEAEQQLRSAIHAL
jgi:hypothetical protein